MDVSSLAQVLKNNPILATGAGLGVGGTLFASLRQVPGTLFGLGKRQIMTTVNVMSGDYCYEYLQAWMHDENFGSTTRNLRVATLYRSNGSGDYEKYLALVPAPGPHVFKFKGRRIWMNLNREKPDQYGRVVEDMTLATLGRDPSVLLELLHEVEAKFMNRKDNLLRVYVQSGEDWKEFCRKKPRGLDTVILDGDVKQSLFDDIMRFKTSQDRYSELGLPWRRGYMFFGPPGNGKSSIVEALAGATGYNLYVLSLGAALMDDQRLLGLLSGVPATGIVLIEDVDAAFVKREKTKDGVLSGVSFSGLLNALDGVGSRPGQIVMMSTNHIEKLDAALLRPGRSDMKCFIDNATPLQGVQLFERFFPHSPLSYDFLAKLEGSEPVSMAALQGHLSTCATADEALAKPIIQ